MSRSPLIWLVAALRSALFHIVFLSGSLALVPLALLGGLVAPGRLMFIGPHLWAGWFRLTSRLICGVRCEIDGEIPPGPHLFALKHEGGYEAILTLWWFQRPAVVMKAELRKIPIWGLTAARHGSIFVDRSGTAGMLREMMRQAGAAVAAGRPVVIFPEGTRVPPGTAPDLAAGFAGLYKILKLPVVPIALDSGRVWPKGWVKFPGTVQLKVGEAIPPGLPRAEVEARVHAAINALNGPVA
ncbi:MAG: lysophospholipid acyltransferase family protein [Sphingomonadales bacterium]